MYCLNFLTDYYTAFQVSSHSNKKVFYVNYERSLLIDRGDILSHWDPKFGLEDSIEEYNLAEAAHAHGKNCCCSFIFLQLEAYCSLIPNV